MATGVAKLADDVREVVCDTRAVQPLDERDGQRGASWRVDRHHHGEVRARVGLVVDLDAQDATCPISTG